MDYKFNDIPVILVKFILISAFLILTGFSFNKLISKEIRKDVNIEYGPTYPDFTICPSVYNEDLGG